MSHLEREAAHFYTKFGARDPAAAASDFQSAYLTLFRDIKDWTTDRPKLPMEAREKGRILYLPSQDRSRVITELRQVAKLLDSTAKRHSAGEAKRGRPAKRKELSSYACEALLGLSPVGKALFAPLRDQDSRTLSGEDFKEAQTWGQDDWRVDAILTKRASARLARDPSIVGYGLAAIRRSLFPDTARRLLEASDACQQDVPLSSFVEAMDPGSITNLAENARQAEKELRVAFGMEDPGKEQQQNRTVTDFMKLAPLYRFVCAVLEAGWRFNAQGSLMFEPVAVDERERLLVGKKGRECEKGLVRLLESARKWAPEIATTFFKMKDNNVFVGVNLPHILKDLGSLAGEDDYPEGALSTATLRICNQVIRQREQIIVLRDHAVTLLRWSESLRAHAPPSKAVAQEAEFLLRNAYYPVWDWMRECEAQYYEGVFYAPDIRRRISGTPEGVQSLSVKLLRRLYTQGVSGGPRYAVVVAKEMASLLRTLYGRNDQILRRLVEIFEKHYAMRGDPQSVTFKGRRASSRTG